MSTPKISRKGESPLSESTLAIISLIISFILIVIFANSILSTQSNVAYSQAIESITRDIAIAIDRSCGLAGSTKIEYEIPKGVKLNISIYYKSIQASFDSSLIMKSFSCMRLSNKVSFVEPNNLCIVKNRNDRKVFVIEGKCKCKINDGVCDPACAAENICDPDCYKSESDGICLGICVKNNDGICDPDCYRNESDYVWDLDCRNEEKDGICDPDSHNIHDGICDQDCYTKESVVCDPDCKPKDENNDKEEDEKDGFCYTGCLNSSYYLREQIKIEPQKKYNLISNYSCNKSVDWSNTRCADGISLYQCGEYIGTCADRCNDIVLCEGEECKNRQGAWCHAKTQGNGSKLACCCEMSGKCYIEQSRRCIIENAGQTYPLNHEYCKGLTDSGKTSESNLLKSKIFLLPDGICDKDCEEENGICDPDCTKDKDCKMQCAKLGENCSSLPPCPGEGICCPGDKIVRKNCCGNGICEPREMWLLGNETRWENFYTCRQDCNSTKDNTCARVLDNVSDPDCIDNFQKYGQANYLYCDPDCVSQHSGICPYTDPTQQSIQDGICLEIIDNVCDPDCANDTLRCDPDCCNGFNVANPCAASPGCHCPTRANISSNFNGAFWFSETNNEPDCNRHNPRITQNVIEICSQEAIEFLNRRGWDIKEVEKSLKTSPPEGFAFDFSRYETILNGVQKASDTIKANEEYNLSESSCCCRSDCSCGACINSTICCGVGFCGDHGVAILSILRTLGIPAKDVFDTFTGAGGSCMRHSFVVYKCDPDLPENMKLEECQNNWNEWMIVDATGHFVSALRGSGSCSNLCIWWNDYGVYPTIDPDIYGFGGKIDATRGRPFPQEIGCSIGGACAMDRVCQLFGINCIS